MQAKNNPSGLAPSFLSNNNKTFLSITSLNKTLYLGGIPDLDQEEYFIIVIDNTAFPKYLVSSPYYMGSFVPGAVFVDIVVTTTLDISATYYNIFLACKKYYGEPNSLVSNIITVLGLLLALFFVVFYYKFSVLYKKNAKIEKQIKSMT